MNNVYIKEKLPRNISRTILNILNQNSTENILDHNMWIAGGFARIVGKSLEMNLPIEKLIKYYFLEVNGDIDIFTFDANNIPSLLKKFERNAYISEAPFAHNLYYRDDNIHFANIQIVSKFTFDSYEKCLDSFDFTNCKYLIYKEKEDLYLLKDNRAEGLNKSRLLNIDKCTSPLLSSRIVKYLGRHNFLNLSTSEETSESLNEYLYRITSNSWEEKFNVLGDLNNIADTYIRNLHRKVNFNNEQLSILIGKFNETVYNTIRSGYGFYLQEVGKTDWASHEIQKRSI